MLGPRWSPAYEQRLLRDAAAPPWPLMWLGKILLRWIYWLPDALIPPPLRINDLSFANYTLAHSLRCVTALGIADELKDGPLTAAQLSKRLGTHLQRLFRLMRFVTAYGVFTTEAGSHIASADTTRFMNNPLSACLREDHPNSQKYLILLTVGNECTGGGWTDLEWGIRTGGDMMNKFYGADFFDHVSNTDGLEDIYSKAMWAIDHSGAKSIVDDYSWQQYTRFVDIAGAYGSFLADLLHRHTTATGVLFDQAQVIARAEAIWQDRQGRKGLLGRVTLLGGDFFAPDTLPAGVDGDVYIMRQICHDWPNADVVRILTGIRTAMNASAARLVIIEAIPTEPTRPIGDVMNRARMSADMHMMVVHDGQERVHHEWEQLLSRSGFALGRIVQTRSLLSILEADPIRDWTAV